MRDANKPWVSVLIPTYNRASLISPCLDSVFRQTYPNIKVIVFDDGSTDDTGKILDKYPIDRVVLNKSNSGIAYARNQLLINCDTPLAAWQDSDDISNVYRIEKQVDSMLLNPTPLVYCHYVRVNGVPAAFSQHPEVGGNHPSRCIGGTLFQTGLGASIFFDERLQTGEDEVWKLSVEKEFGPSSVVDLLLYFYRMHPKRISKTKLHKNNRARHRANQRILHSEIKRLRKPNTAN